MTFIWPHLVKLMVNFIEYYSSLVTYKYDEVEWHNDNGFKVLIKINFMLLNII